QRLNQSLFAAFIKQCTQRIESLPGILMVIAQYIRRQMIKLTFAKQHLGMRATKLPEIFTNIAVLLLQRLAGTVVRQDESRKGINNLLMKLTDQTLTVFEIQI